MMLEFVGGYITEERGTIEVKVRKLTKFDKLSKLWWIIWAHFAIWKTLKYSCYSPLLDSHMAIQCIYWTKHTWYKYLEILGMRGLQTSISLLLQLSLQVFPACRCLWSFESSLNERTHSRPFLINQTSFNQCFSF